jgi:hypothetical protein
MGSNTKETLGHQAWMPSVGSPQRFWPKTKGLAEREGFEPSSGETPEPDFESGAFDHSATFPGCAALGRALLSGLAPPASV